MIDKQSAVPASTRGSYETCRALLPAEIDAVAGGTQPAPTVHPATATYLTITLNNTMISG